MKLPMYAVRDVRAITFGPPYLGTNDYTFCRGLAEQILNGQAREMAFSPQDFDVYRIGEYDLDSGNVAALDPIVLVSNVAEVVSNYGYKKE